jgi:thiol-disulfide isomerase/thioredoxin
MLIAVLTGCDQYGSPAVPSATPAATPAHAWEAPGQHIVAFTMEGCQKCKQEHPQLMQLHDEGRDVIELDYHENEQLAKELGVHSLPHYFVFQDGQMVKSADTVGIIMDFVKVGVFVLYWILF